MNGCWLTGSAQMREGVELGDQQKSPDAKTISAGNAEARKSEWKEMAKSTSNVHKTPYFCRPLRQTIVVWGKEAEHAFSDWQQATFSVKCNDQCSVASATSNTTTNAATLLI
ncbi:unnamed protein product [Thelazia callipaeda]|uniref:Uncharacterized protein n=1 Tax=Thelazia callipaeda TaxID=103827 RepID=A0A0N5D407_THECL|nr:unnamed protein product [Thelazia callipaeda]